MIGTAWPRTAVARWAGGLYLAYVVANVLASQQHGGKFYVDVIFRPTPGAGLDYSSILHSVPSDGPKRRVVAPIGSPAEWRRHGPIWPGTI